MLGVLVASISLEFMEGERAAFAAHGRSMNGKLF